MLVPIRGATEPRAPFLAVLVLGAFSSTRASGKCIAGAESLNPKALRTHIIRLLGPRTILCEAFGLF